MFIIYVPLFIPYITYFPVMMLICYTLKWRKKELNTLFNEEIRADNIPERVERKKGNVKRKSREGNLNYGKVAQ